MIVDTKYMARCIELAQKARGYTNPNPMVGAVVVHDDCIIGEGYHQKGGEAHAEVNAIDSVKDKSLLVDSTLYVSLEPCSHFGKTPPCSQLIIDSKIPRVVIGTLDPFSLVSGRGLKMLKEAGIQTKVGILEDECQDLNKEFFVKQTKSRPYIYLKWAQSKDGFIDKERLSDGQPAAKISNDFTQLLVHKLRSEVDAIMVGTNTVQLDNPSLTTRMWFGKNPLRVVLDRQAKISKNKVIFNDGVQTLIFTASEETAKKDYPHVEYCRVDFSKDREFLKKITEELNNRNVQSVLVEGGAQLLQSFIDAQLWDEIVVEVSDAFFTNGVNAPILNGNPIAEQEWLSSRLVHYRNNSF